MCLCSQLARLLTLSAAKIQHFLLGSAAKQLYPYDSNDFHRVCLAMVVAASDSSAPSGNIILARANDRGEKTDRENSLVLAIGGDALVAIGGLVSKAEPQRPIALDLLWKVCTS